MIMAIIGTKCSKVVLIIKSNTVFNHKKGRMMYLPNHYYKFTKKDKKFSIDFFVIDTNLDLMDSKLKGRTT